MEPQVTDGPTAVLAVLQNIVDIKNAIHQLIPSSMEEDYQDYRDVPLPVDAVNVYPYTISPPGQVGYLYIPNLPRACTIWSGIGHARYLGSFVAGAGVNMVIPAGQDVTIEFAASGVAGQMVSVWISSRPINVGIMDTGTIASMTSYLSTMQSILNTMVGSVHQEDFPALNNDVGQFMLGVANQALATMVSADGDYTQVSTNTRGQVLVAAGLQASAVDAQGNGGIINLYDKGASQGPLNTVQSSYNGAAWDRLRTPNIFKTFDLAAATAETTIWTPSAGKKFRLMGMLITCQAASTLTFKDNTAGTTIFVTRGGIDVPIQPSGLGNGILSAVANNLLTVTRGTSVALTGTVWGTEE